jgi:hypothetical protein
MLLMIRKSDGDVTNTLRQLFSAARYVVPICIHIVALRSWLRTARTLQLNVLVLGLFYGSVGMGRSFLRVIETLANEHGESSGAAYSSYSMVY